MSENRISLWTDYVKQGGNDHRIVKRMFLDYSRYYEAELISAWFIERKIKLDFSILDYGCGVGDYGMFLLRQGANKVDFYDYPRAIYLVAYRLGFEKFKRQQANIINPDTNQHPNMAEYDFVIFGEVLEHLSSPLKVLKSAMSSKYIFTSSYPYRTDDPNDSYWSNHDHGDKARLEQPLCRKLLEDNYEYTKLAGELRMWAKK
jgi:SAM-dependent methyltransferase